MSLFLRRMLFALAVALAVPAMAQSDPPARVGRLSLIENQVFFRVDRNDQGSPATVNWPVSSASILETGPHGRAEVWIGSTAYRLGDDSQIEFSAVDDTRVDLHANGGSLAVSILDRDQVEDTVVATPDGDVRFLTPGRYRIDVYADHSELSVQAGQATFAERQRVIPVAAGQKASRWDNGRERVDGDWDEDSFDRWVSNRENATLAAVSRHYLSPRMTGYQDLDAYGDWQTMSDYGSVWYPRLVTEDWAPYRDGRWAWVAPWGWTRIDQAPWGFAPFHYGRWAMIRGRWGWIPGNPVSRPVYAPALVGWIGNPGWNVGFSAGAAPAVGWFPLAPHEVYVPSYHYSQNYVRQINIGHIRDIAAIDRFERGDQREPFAYNALPRAVTVVPARLMREGRLITTDENSRYDRSSLGQAPLARHAPTADWLAPAPGAAHPPGDNRPPRHNFEAQRQNPAEHGAPAPADRPVVRQSESRHEVLRGSPELRQGTESNGRPLDPRPLAPVVAPPRRESAQDIHQPPPEDRTNDIRRSYSRNMGEAQTAPPAAPAPMRREMPVPEIRHDEQQQRTSIPPQEREAHREIPRPAPEIRSPAPPPQQRAEPPRPAPQANGQNEQRHRPEDDHGSEH